MKTRTRWLAGLALAGLLGSATASLAQKGDEKGPRPPDWEGGRFARAGNVLVDVTRIEYLEIQPLENGDSILSIYLAGRANPIARVRGKDAGGLLDAMGVGSKVQSKIAPGSAPGGNQP